ncbi:MAG: trigger factor [Lachnospiraceae bacterium]|nr:trigger factor [Lachnospiraceae bacterium]
MKKKLALLLMAMLTISMFTGCGADGAQESTESTESTATESSTAENNTTEQVRLKDLDVENYVTLGEYKGIAVTVAAASVDEAELEEAVYGMYVAGVTKENGGVTDRVVAEGDTANIDYVGKKDGVAFEGGTAQGHNLTIGSNSFIDGFEDGLIGVMPGETVDLNLTFPEGYGNADLAGQEVVFTVTVNFILPTEIEDSVIANMGIENVTNEAELREYANDYLYENAVAMYDSNVLNSVMSKFMKNCTFTEVPQNMVDNYSQIARESITATAATYGMDPDTFTAYFYGMGFEDFLETYSVQTVQQDIALQAVANKENLNLSDEELDAELLTNAQAAGYETVEEFIGDASKEDYREYLMYNKVMEFIVENAVVSNE